jgi:hypothetical protein
MDTYVPKHRASVGAFQYFHPLEPPQRKWLGDSFITDHKSGLRIYGDGPSDGGISAVLDVGPGDWVVESHGALRVMTDHEFNRTYEPQQLSIEPIANQC